MLDGKFSHQMLEAELAESTEPVRGGLALPPSGRHRGCLRVPPHSLKVKVTGKEVAEREK